MKPLSPGIRFQLIAGIVLVTLASIGLIGLLSIKIIENSAIYWKITESEKIVRIIRSAFNGKNGPEYARIESALKAAGVSSFRLNGTDGKPVSSSGSITDAGGELIPSDGMTVKRLGGGWFKGPGDSLYVLAPLASRGKTGETVEFMVPLGDIGEDMANVRKFLFFYALLDSFIIISFGVYFLSRSIISPLKKLNEAATRIAGGKLFERAQVSVDNEIGSLASSFNTMAERLELEIKTLERLNIELMTAQEELLRSSTLASVGRLAAGIAHEIGNPLGAVNGYLDILDKGLDDKAGEKEIIARTMKEVSRIDAIVREFLDISRPPKKPAPPVDINRVVEDALGSAAAHRDFDGVKTELLLSENIPPASIDEGKLRQVLFNLIMNAAHSMERTETKVITIETGTEMRPYERRKKRRRDDPPVLNAVGREKEYVYIKVTDNGSGIREDDLIRIFDPFFTTKEVGRGTGLGLFVSQSIIKAYGGEIGVRSGGGGSVFTVSLPSGVSC